jgi:phage shock protein A
MELNTGVGTLLKVGESSDAPPMGISIQWDARRQAEEMANPFVKFWKYLMAAFSSKIDEHADPKVQIQQAIEEAQRNHQALSQQAASVIGNQRQLEMKLNRQLGDVEKLQASTRQALVLADEARTHGDEEKATQFETAAESFAAQLVTAEQSIEDLKTLHDQSLQAATQAKTAVERNSSMLQQKLAERTKLLSQLEQAKMQEKVSASLNQMSELAAPGNTPSLEEVREKIEKRYTTALGSAELAQNSVQGRMLEVQHSTTQLAGHSRLEQIRASMKGDSVAQVTDGSSAAAAAAKSAATAKSAADVQKEIQARVQAEEQKNEA